MTSATSRGPLPVLRVCLHGSPPGLGGFKGLGSSRFMTLNNKTSAILHDSG